MIVISITIIITFIIVIIIFINIIVIIVIILLIIIIIMLFFCQMQIHKDWCIRTVWTQSTHILDNCFIQGVFL